jgi:hypothetical protein
MRARVKAAAAGVACLLVVGIAPAAAAEIVERRDASGDAPASIDITRATYKHSLRRVSAVARVPGLGQRGSADLAVSRFEIFEAGYVVRIRKRVGEPATVRLLFFNHFDLEPRACDGVRGRWTENRVALSVPRRCLEGHARRNVFAQVGLRRGQDVDLAPAVRRLTRG